MSQGYRNIWDIGCPHIVIFVYFVIQSIDTIIADAGYDSEANHTYSREELKIHSIINPLVGLPTNKLPNGKYRKEMMENFDKERYGERWQSETVISMLKRNLSESILSKTYWSQCREMALKVLTHNIMIVCLRKYVFSTEQV